MKTKVKTIDGIDIYFEPLEEHTSPRDMFEDCDADEICKNIDSGKYVWFTAKVSAEFKGLEIGADYLGGCCYNSYEDFYNEGQADYFTDMVNTALKEGKQALKAIKNEINTLEL